MPNANIRTTETFPTLAMVLSGSESKRFVNKRLGRYAQKKLEGGFDKVKSVTMDYGNRGKPKAARVGEKNVFV